jgi:hypothetical protein
VISLAEAQQDYQYKIAFDPAAKKPKPKKPKKEKSRTRTNCET